jgi:hypothetical protein
VVHAISWSHQGVVVSLARKQERMRREAVGATLLAVARWLRSLSKVDSPEVSRAFVDAAEVLEARIKGAVSGTNEQKEAG